MTFADQFDQDYFDRLRAVRDHWWVRGMQGVGAALLGERRTGLAVLDAGCGSGSLLPWLQELAAPGRVAAVDFAPAAVAYCRQLGLGVDLSLASVTNLPFDEARFDLVVSMDVLQHLTVPQSSVALREMRRVLRPGGRLLLRTNSAFGRGKVAEREDWRLYDSRSLRTALVDAGYEVERLTSANALQGLWASVPRRPRGHHDHHDHDHDDHAAPGEERPEWGVAGLGIPRPVHPAKNRALLAVLRAEARYLARPGSHLPFGHSLYAVARRPRGVGEG